MVCTTRSRYHAACVAEKATIPVKIEKFNKVLDELDDVIDCKPSYVVQRLRGGASNGIGISDLCNDDDDIAPSTAPTIGEEVENSIGAVFDYDIDMLIVAIDGGYAVPGKATTGIKHAGWGVYLIGIKRSSHANASQTLVSIGAGAGLCGPVVTRKTPAFLQPFSWGATDENAATGEWSSFGEAATYIKEHVLKHLPAGRKIDVQYRMDRQEMRDVAYGKTPQVQNAQLIKKVMKVVNEVKALPKVSSTEFAWVKGHSTDWLNMRADYNASQSVNGKIIFDGRWSNVWASHAQAANDRSAAAKRNRRNVNSDGAFVVRTGELVVTVDAKCIDDCTKAGWAFFMADGITEDQSCGKSGYARPKNNPLSADTSEKLALLEGITRMFEALSRAEDIPARIKIIVRTKSMRELFDKEKEVRSRA